MSAVLLAQQCKRRGGSLLHAKPELADHCEVAAAAALKDDRVDAVAALYRNPGEVAHDRRSVCGPALRQRILPSQVLRDGVCVVGSTKDPVTGVRRSGFRREQAAGGDEHCRKANQRCSYSAAHETGPVREKLPNVNGVPFSPRNDARTQHIPPGKRDDREYRTCRTGIDLLRVESSESSVESPESRDTAMRRRLICELSLRAPTSLAPRLSSLVSPLSSLLSPLLFSPPAGLAGGIFEDHQFPLLFLVGIELIRGELNQLDTHLILCIDVLLVGWKAVVIRGR